MNSWVISKLFYIRERRFIKIAKSIVILIEKENYNEADRVTREVLNPIVTTLKVDKKIFEQIIAVHEDILDLLRDRSTALIQETKKDIEVAEQLIQ